MAVINNRYSKHPERINNARRDERHATFCPAAQGVHAPFFEKRISGSVSSHDLVFHAFGRQPEKAKQK